MKKILVDIGAHVGLFCLEWVKNPNNMAYAFEANPQLANALENKSKNLPNLKVYNGAASDIDGEALFYISQDIGCSSLKPFTDGVNNWPISSQYGSIQTKEEIVVKTIRMDSFMKQENIEKIDFLKIDAQGSDLCILQSLGDRIMDVEKIKCECFTYRHGSPLYEDEAKEDQVLAFMTEKGFRLINRNIHTAALFVDLTFIKNNKENR